MSLPSDSPRSAANAVLRLTLGPGWGWSRHELSEGVVSIKGYLFDGAKTLEGESAARHAATVLSGTHDDPVLTRALSQLAGHFALVLEAPGRTIATVDRVRSIPLAHATRQGVTYIDDRARRLRDALGLGPADLDSDQVLAAAMSGYTIGPSTIYRGLHDLGTGQALVVDGKGQRVLRWFTYDAWRTEEIAEPEKRLSELHRFLVERLAKSAAGRTICVPLSAGYDSRFVAAGLRAAGAKNVRLFSYGRAGNHEAETAKLIAERLGYPWRFVPFTSRSQAAMFADPEHEKALWEIADSCASAPFEQDWSAIAALRRDGYIPADAIIVNGNSGDYISGNHAPLSLMQGAPGETAEQRQDRVTAACVKKHFRLWRSLATPANDARIEDLLRRQAAAAGVKFSEGEALFGIHEMLEYQDRQAKYVVSGQRTYEAQGLSWRLPLWDDELIHFWRRASGELKREQNLYRCVLEADDWGNAFSSIPLNKKTITPAWIRPVRLTAKVACAPLGAEHWHSIERRAFGWWMDPLRTPAIVGYGEWLKDEFGVRHAISWVARRHLERHGVDFCGLPARS